MALTAHALVTLADTKEHLGIPAGNATYDSIVERFINATTDRLEKLTGRRLKQRLGITEYHDGLGNTSLLLDEWPAVKPTEVWIDRSSAFTDATKQLEIANYELDLSPRGEGIGIVLVGGCNGRLFPQGRRNIKVVYDGGYADVPYDLQDVVFWEVEYLWNMRTDDSIGVMVKGKNQENTTFREGMPKIIQETIDVYTRVEIPTGYRAVGTF